MQPINLYFVPNLPIIERNIILASLEFIKNYQFLMKKEMNNPNVAVMHQNSMKPDPEPLDLTLASMNKENNCQILNDENNSQISNNALYDMVNDFSDLMDLNSLLDQPPKANDPEMDNIIAELCSPYV